MVDAILQTTDFATIVRNVVDRILEIGGEYAHSGKVVIDATTSALGDWASASTPGSPALYGDLGLSPTEIDVLRDAGTTAIAAIKILPAIVQTVLSSGLS